MLRSISGYFTRRLLGESAEKDKQLVSDLKRVYRPDYSIIGFQLTARERLRLRDILNVSNPRTRDAVITHQHFFKNKVKAMKVKKMILGVTFLVLKFLHFFFFFFFTMTVLFTFLST